MKQGQSQCTDGNFNVKHIDLSNNNLKGKIPPELGKLLQLRFIYLYNNQLTGNIPTELGQLATLFYLYLNNNQLTGHIPAELGQLSSLFRLILNDNQLTNNIPTELGKISKLENLNLSNNQLTGNIPAELGLISKLGSLNLSNNQLIGGIPSGLSQLKVLYTLSLQSNNLSQVLTSDFLNTLHDTKTNLNNNCFEAIPSTITVFESPKISLYGRRLPKSVWGKQRVNCHVATHFNEQTGLVTITNVVAAGLNYYVELQRLDENKFQLTKVLPLNNPAHEIPVSYDFNTLLLEISSVFVLGQSYKVQMRNNNTANNIFVITSVTLN